MNYQAVKFHTEESADLKYSREKGTCVMEMPKIQEAKLPAPKPGETELWKFALNVNRATQIFHSMIFQKKKIMHHIIWTNSMLWSWEAGSKLVFSGIM